MPRQIRKPATIECTVGKNQDRNSGLVSVTTGLRGHYFLQRTFFPYKGSCYYCFSSISWAFYPLHLFLHSVTSTLLFALFHSPRPQFQMYICPVLQASPWHWALLYTHQASQRGGVSFSCANYNFFSRWRLNCFALFGFSPFFSTWHLRFYNGLGWHCEHPYPVK
jgi:hypothetical protein